MVCQPPQNRRPGGAPVPRDDRVADRFGLSRWLLEAHRADWRLLLGACSLPGLPGRWTVFASTDGAGVYRSTDGGDTWQNVSKGLGHRSIRALAVSPAFGTDSTVFAAGPDGVYKSVDAGATWVHSVDGLKNPRVLALAVSPAFASDSTVFAGTSVGLFRSTDGGTSWRQVKEGLTRAAIVSLEVSPAFERDSTVFAGMLGQRTVGYMGGAMPHETPPGGIFRSTDGGTSWEIYENLKTVSAMSISLSPAFEQDSTAFVGTLGSGIFRSTDGGDSWVQVGQGLPYERFVSVEVSPGFPSDSTVFAGAYGTVFRSENGGRTWEQLNDGVSISGDRVSAGRLAGILEGTRRCSPALAAAAFCGPSTPGHPGIW